MTFSGEGRSARRYWQIAFERADNGHDPERLKDELTELITDATRIRLRADVPVGAYLSGGLDSMLITSLVRKRFDNRLCTFSVAFTDARYDERSFQEKAVNELETDHRFITCSEQDIARVLPDIVWHTETPILRSAPAPLFILSDLVRQSGFKVVLTGEGADELFGGYDLFKEDKIRRFWARDPDSSLRPLLLKRIYPDIFTGMHGRLGRFQEDFFKRALLDTDLDHYSHLIRWENGSMMKALFSDDVKEAVRSGEGFLERYRAELPPGFRSWDPLSKAQYTEISIFLSNYLLSSQGDRVAMAHSIEGRFPYLDHRVIEYAFRLPSKYALAVLKEKYILRRTAENFLSVSFSNRPKKPYRAPISRCFFGDSGATWPMDLLSEPEIRRTGFFNFGKVKLLTDKCRKNNGLLPSERENMALMGLLTTQLLSSRMISDYPPQEQQAPGRLKRISLRSEEVRCP